MEFFAVNQMFSKNHLHLLGVVGAKKTLHNQKEHKQYLTPIHQKELMVVVIIDNLLRLRRYKKMLLKK
jgi:hypothetical protein